MAANKEKISRRIIKCDKCKTQSDCCQFGAWIDLEEAKKIIARGIKGDFFHFEKDDEFPSGYRVGTSCIDNHCSFLDPDGLCRIHKVDYALKPKTCKDFPYEKGKISYFTKFLCTPYKSKKKRRTK